MHPTPPATADLMDADDALASCSIQFRHFGRRARFAGRIETVRCRHDNALIRTVLGESRPGSVLVVDGGGSLESALVGDRLAALAVANGWAGLVVHGAIRDSVAIDGLEIGVRALGTNPRRSAKAGHGERGVEVEFGGVRFVPGHYLYGDEDGLVVSPVAR